MLAFEPVPPPPADDPLLAFAPYLHPRPRRNSITPELQRRFVAALAATGIVQQASRTIGKSMEALYKLRARPAGRKFRGRVGTRRSNGTCSPHHISRSGAES